MRLLRALLLLLAVATAQPHVALGTEPPVELVEDLEAAGATEEAEEAAEAQEFEPPAEPEPANEPEAAEDAPVEIEGEEAQPEEDQPPPPSAAPSATGGLTLQGSVFLDLDRDGQQGEPDAPADQVEVRLIGPAGRDERVRTDLDGQFFFEQLQAGRYTLKVRVPGHHTATTPTEVEVALKPELPAVHFGLAHEPPEAPVAADSEALPEEVAGEEPPLPEEVAEPAEDPELVAEEQEQPEGDDTALAEALAEEAPGDELAEDAADDQLVALRAVSSLPLRFAAGRDLLAQVQRRELADSALWLGVPFRTQVDGSEFQWVNCGPASLSMVLAGFGLDVEAGQVREYLNQMIDNYDPEVGTSLDVLSDIARQAGLTPVDLYSDAGGYRAWSPEAIRWHVEQGHPVITLVKYRQLPGHSETVADTDHYVVISGLTPTGFIYNDAAFSSTLGYGLEMSDAELVAAWENTSIPRHAVALGLGAGTAALSFPEVPPLLSEEPEVEAPPEEFAEEERLRPPTAAASRAPSLTGWSAPRAAQVYEPAPRSESATPRPEAAPEVVVGALLPAVPDDAAPMGLLLEDAPASLPASDYGETPLRLAGLTGVLLGSLWLAALAWSILGSLRRFAPLASSTLGSIKGLVAPPPMPLWRATRALAAALLSLMRSGA